MHSFEVHSNESACRKKGPSWAGTSHWRMECAKWGELEINYVGHAVWVEQICAVSFQLLPPLVHSGDMSIKGDGLITSNKGNGEPPPPPLFIVQYWNTPLIRYIHEEHIEVMKPCYTKNAGDAGDFRLTKDHINGLLLKILACGYLPDPKNMVLIV